MNKNKKEEEHSIEMKEIKQEIESLKSDNTKIINEQSEKKKNIQILLKQ